MKFKTLSLDHMVGKTLQEVKGYLEKLYSKETIASEEHREEFIKQNPDCEEWVWFYFFASLVRDSGGYWDVPCAGRGGSSFARSANWLGSDWSSDCRVVLFEIDSVPGESVAEPLSVDSPLLSLETAIELVKKEGYEVYKKM